MTNQNASRRHLTLIIGLLAGVLGGCLSGQENSFSVGAWSQAGLRKPTPRAQLTAYQPLPEMNPELCMVLPVATDTAAALQQDPLLTGRTASQPAEAGVSDRSKRAPLRVIQDPYPSFSSIAVDMVRDEVVVTDENLFQIMLYDRLENNPPRRVARPKRVISGHRTKIAFQCGLYLDQPSGEIYAVNNDTYNTLPVFSREAQGDVPPDRELETPHGTFGIAVDEEHQELFLTVQHDSAVVVYHKTASGKEAPIRLLQGNNTRLADPHGIAVDSENDLIFVTNHGSVHQVSPDAGTWLQTDTYLAALKRVNWPLNRDFAVPGSGQNLSPSITVYERTASGDTAPLRVIEGASTRLNWPTGIALHPQRQELFVANDAEDTILVFKATASGNAAPIRVLQGSRTGLKSPTGLFLDTRNNELWVANFGGHTATAYPITAEGDRPPLRTLRSAPEGTPSLMIGNPGAVTYDTKREEILVPN